MHMHAHACTRAQSVAASTTGKNNSAKRIRKNHAKAQFQTVWQAPDYPRCSYVYTRTSLHARSPLKCFFSFVQTLGPRNQIGTKTEIPITGMAREMVEHFAAIHETLSMFSTLQVRKMRWVHVEKPRSKWHMTLKHAACTSRDRKTSRKSLCALGNPLLLWNQRTSVLDPLQHGVHFLFHGPSFFAQKPHHKCWEIVTGSREIPVLTPMHLDQRSPTVKASCNILYFSPRSQAQFCLLVNGLRGRYAYREPLACNGRQMIKN